MELINFMSLSSFATNVSASDWFLYEKYGMYVQELLPKSDIVKFDRIPQNNHGVLV